MQRSVAHGCRSPVRDLLFASWTCKLMFSINCNMLAFFVPGTQILSFLPFDTSNQTLLRGLLLRCFRQPGDNDLLDGQPRQNKNQMSQWLPLAWRIRKISFKTTHRRFCVLPQTEPFGLYCVRFVALCVPGTVHLWTGIRIWQFGERRCRFQGHQVLVIRPVRRLQSRNGYLHQGWTGITGQQCALSISMMSYSEASLSAEWFMDSAQLDSQVIWPPNFNHW